jgi:uncharacterized protein (TIGR03437 family)
MRIVRGMLLISAAAWQAAAQGPAWDNSGNGQLNGSYYFREVIYVVADTSGNLNRAISLFGNIVFDGNGNYTLSGAQINDSNSGAVQNISASGTYSISASGYGYLINPLSTSTNVYTVFGLVSNGIFIGSSTEQTFNDMFVAAKVATPLPTASFFQGSYTMSGFFPGGTPASMADAFFKLNPDGAGNLGSVNVNGYYGGGGTTVIGQTTASVKYIFSNGAANVMFPNNSSANFFSGNEYLYFSADGNFVFGGSPTGWDMLVGVKTAAGATQNFGGLYYEAGIDEDVSQGFGELDTFYGSFGATGGNVVGHERLDDLFNSSTEGFTYATTYPSTATSGTYTDPSGVTMYTLGNGGAIRIATGVGPFMGINVAVKAPTLSGPGVFLDATGVANAASAAPFTAGVSPGEFLVLYGANLAPSTLIASVVPYPTSLNGVQVTVNGIPAPIYYVSSTQISIVVPYGITYAIAQIQVTNNGAISNAITEPVNKTTPGVFTLSANGIGYGAIEHANGSVVSAANPAQPGETVAVFVSGLGTVFPPVIEGTTGPVNPLSNTVNTISAVVGANTATVAYAGLAPYLAGLYQINITIPATATSGDNTLAIAGPDSYASQALISVGTGALASSAVPSVQTRKRPASKPRSFVPRTPCFVIDRTCAAQ